ncbi:MAG: pyridoxal-phosphate dependent enzyme [Candidatus Eisenbacteria bacterium]|nr:pyridoxal-phosphate dependent enzyme [Candidatus Eisenbacteria bacterium]
MEGGATPPGGMQRRPDATVFMDRGTKMDGDSAIRNLRCTGCGRDYGADELHDTCPDCGPLRGTLDVIYDTAALAGRFGPALLQGRDDPTLWRYREILPIRTPEAAPPVELGMTPLRRLPPGLAPGFKGTLYGKDETGQPSGSAKDRASIMALARARELQVPAIAAASTGNAASSVAALSAAAQIACVIFAPAGAPAAKLAQIRIHGARLYLVDGDYDEAFDLCSALCARFGWYNRSSAVNPVLGEGKKTIALEIWEQLGYRAPGAVVVPAGDGCILGGIAKGFDDLCDLGLLASRPRLIGVQAAAAPALAEAWRAGRDACRPGAGDSVADSIRVAVPRDQVKALRAVRRSGGAFVTVSDTDILGAMAGLARGAGIFAEPAAAAALAGLRAAMTAGIVRDETEVVLAITGHGLKDVPAAERAARDNQPVAIAADPDRAERTVREGPA